MFDQLLLMHKIRPKYAGLAFVKIVILFMRPDLLRQHSWSPEESKDTHIGKIACQGNCTADGLFMQFGQKLHAHAIFRCMQFHQDGCRSTRLDFRNHVLWDESSGQNKKSLFFKNKIRLYFPLYFFEFLAPISVYHGDRYQKATQKVSGPYMTISESASHFCKYKGNFKKYKEIYSLILFLKNNDLLFCPELSSHRTWFL